MELIVNQRPADLLEGFAVVRTLHDQVAAGERPDTMVITPSVRHVAFTRRDTRRRGYDEAVGIARGQGWPAVVRGAGGGTIAAHDGTFGFSVVRGAHDVAGDASARYDDAADLVLGAFGRLGVAAEAGEVAAEFCPGDHSIRVGGHAQGMKLVGIAQRVARTSTSVGGIVLVHGEAELAAILGPVYTAMGLPLRPGAVGSLRRAGSGATVAETVTALAEQAGRRYAAIPVPLDPATLALARSRHGDLRTEIAT